MKRVVHNQQQTIRQPGFTLLELMVVLAIIGILATLGASQFQGHIARTRVVEGLNLAQPYKLAVAEQITTNGGVFTVAQLGLPAFTPTQDVTAIEVTPMATRGVGGVITVSFGPRVGGGGTLTLTPTITTNSIQWQCAAARATTPVASPAATPAATSAATPPANPDGAVANTRFEPGTLPPEFAPANCRG